MVQRIISNSLFTRFIITFRTSKSSELTLFVVSWANRSSVRDFFPPVNSAAAGCAWRAEEIFSNKRDGGRKEKSFSKKLQILYLVLSVSSQGGTPVNCALASIPLGLRFRHPDSREFQTRNRVECDTARNGSSPLRRYIKKKKKKGKKISMLRIRHDKSLSRLNCASSSLSLSLRHCF